MQKLSERKKKWVERTVANDRSYKLFLYNRFFIFLILALSQLVGFAILFSLLVYNSRLGLSLQILLAILELFFVLYIVNKNERPSTKMNWVLLIVLLPVFGVPFYLLYGEGRPTRKMRNKVGIAKKENKKSVAEFYGERTPFAPQNRGEAVSYYLDVYNDYPVYKDGEVSYYKSGEDMFPVMLDELKKAEKFILVEYFIIAHGKMWNSILEILLEKAMQGVQIRIIYDDFGCMMTLPPKYDRYLESLHENIRCMTFNNVVPLFAVRMNNRDHRKILVIDGKVAFTGGINLADEYIAEKQRFGYWKDTGVKITGNAVNSFTQMFFYMWNAFRKDKEDIKKFLTPLTEQPNQAFISRIQPYDDSPLDKISTGESVYMDMIGCAEKYVYIFTPYLVLDDFMRSALISAATRGVDVRIVTPGIPDKKLIYRITRANYDILIKAGVKIYEYTPGFIHAKSVLCDGRYAVVGTINFDYRSLYLHFENALYFSDCKAVEDLKQDCEETFALATLRNDTPIKRGFIGRVLDSLFRLFETLL
ncbi:MAG: cardiolipin synthase [Clostridia bacterium]|nr:cardiolipin synthase [Clostridia bacterium]